jgi:hypothetical protein
MPLFAVPFADFLGMEVPISARPTWLLSAVEPPPATEVASWPAELHLEHVTWNVQFRSSGVVLEAGTATGEPIHLQKGTCIGHHCSYEVVSVSSAVPDNLLGFTVARGDLPDIPEGWPKPLALIEVVVELTAVIKPAAVTENFVEGIDTLALSGTLIARDAIVHLVNR